ncbi:glycoside hydrolase family 43 protein [Deinococcus peraridilitoris]|uniref:Beta-xylosidase n=1 Tax=Deinococcus peraridilitoris (strain DSM 19664 / LMG 22246 / CIP 109416 / KR-200) TaxID=937777 RepID=L0A0D6_DEIPD|nr:glycoside hydrolase family 43 protein [Deinococcus peraridilitoris]AFZ66480.1 beta-xylosidase [Deinococcus peraridilitoris DSM 19664]
MTRRYSLLGSAPLLASLTFVMLGDSLAGGGAPLASPPAAQSSATRTYTNPVIDEDFPDPFVLRVGRTYYAYATNTNGIDVPVHQSNDLVTWQFVGNAMPTLAPWASSGFTWAPEVMAVKDGYTLYYTARHTESGRQCIGVATASKPEGPFQDRSRQPLVCQLDLGGSIDASPFTDKDGQRYLYWKNDGNCCNQLTSIWVQKLSADGKQLLGQPKDLISNAQLWEGNLIEAPNVWRREGKYYLFYSAADYASDTYAVGVALGSSPTGPFRKLNRDEPWLATRGEVAGPGGQGIISDGAGNTWLYYHAWTEGQIGYEAGGQRSMRLDLLQWKNGLPVLRGPSLSRQNAPTRP